MTPVFEGLSRKGADAGPSAPPARDTATPSVIGSGMELDGQLRARGDLRIEGRVKGSIRTEGEVVVAPRGVVDGDIEASEVNVGGRVTGSVVASEAARFMEGCHVDAEVRAPVVQIEEGGVVNGRLVMEKESAKGSGSRSSGSSGSSSTSGTSGSEGRSGSEASGGGTSGGSSGSSSGGSGSSGSGKK